MKFLSSLVLSAAALATLQGCGGGEGGGNVPVLPSIADSGSGGPGTDPAAPPPASLPAPSVELGTSTAIPGLSLLYQFIPIRETRQDYTAPGSPNQYELNRDFTTWGGLDQWNPAMSLRIEQGGVSAVFPPNQVYAEFSYSTPEVRVPAGAAFMRALVSSPDLAAGTSWSGFANTSTIAWFTSSPDSRLQQTVTLPAAPSGPLLLTWQTETDGGLSEFGWIPGEPHYFRVVLRETGGALIETVFDETGNSIIKGTNGVADLSAHAGRTLVISFESRTLQSAPYGYFGPGIDNVSLKDGLSELIVNGDFESGASGWTTNSPVTSQNVTSGARTVAGLEVRRSVYAPIDESWGRWTDMISNPGASTMTATVTYTSTVGRAGQAFIARPAGLASGALTLWDASVPAIARDTGLVFGNAGEVSYRSASAIGAGDGDKVIRVRYPVTLPPGGTVSIVQFLILTTSATWQTAADAAARPVEAEATATGIATNFRTDPKYRRGMTQRQLDTILNF